MIIYIHGFGGSGYGSKATLLREIFASQNIIAPSLSYVPLLAIDTLSQIIESYIKHEPIYLIGSSLGGYYSIYLAHKYDLKAVLINPATTPTITLSNMIGQALNYTDLSKFEWNESHIKMLEAYAVKSPKKENFLLLLQTGDEVIDYTVAVKYLDGSKQIIIDGGNHSFDGLENYIQEIEKFFKG